MESFIEQAASKKKEGRRKNYLTNKGKYVCDLCDVKTESLFHLNRHKKNKHSGSRQAIVFPCNLCEYEGCEKYYLSAHMKKKHGEHREIACSQCAYITTNTGNLSKHTTE